MTTRRRSSSRAYARTLAATLAIAIVPAVAAVQQPVRSPASPSVPVLSGTARLAGVVKDERDQPVHHAIVRLTGAGLAAGLAAITDEAGRFSLERLPAGRFMLTSSKPAYLTTAFGARRPGGSGVPIAVGDGEQLTTIALTMPRGAVIAGVIRDERGSPISGIQVTAARAPGTANAGRSEPAFTDDRGAYRIFGLLPGSYFVSADRIGTSGLGEIGSMSTAEVDTALARLQQRSTSGAPPRPSSERTPSSVVQPTGTSTLVPVFFPGAISPAAVTPVTVAAGEIREDVSFVYQMVRTVAVSGTVSGAGSQTVQISLSPEASPMFAGTGFGSGAVLRPRASNGDGDFMFTSVVPGKYTLVARTGTGRVIPGPPTGREGGSPAAAPGPPAQTLYAVASVEVTNDDVAGVALALQPTLRVTGRVSVQPGTSAPPDLTTTGVRLMMANGPSDGVLAAVGLGNVPIQATARASADGTFEVAGVMPGTYKVIVVEPTGWIGKSAMLGSRDLLDVPLVVGAADVTGIDVSLSDRRSQLSGRLMQADGIAATGYFVIVFTADRAQWLPQARRLRSVRPGTDGQFRIDDLPAGEYYIAALTDADSDEWQSSPFLAQVIASAVKITLVDGERKVQDLRIGR